jgi:TusA-related sulfurtransferase
MYKLLKDKNNEFQCEIKLEGASINNATARLFLEADGAEYSFKGEIDGNKCTIPMGKLKKFANLLENGKIRLEVLADDTLFVPYESNYVLEAEKSVTVEIKQQAEAPKKPMMEVKVQEVAPTPQPKVEVKPQPKPVVKKSKDPLNEIVSYFAFKTNFDGSPKSFHTLIKNQQHKNFFNNVCEANGLDKVSVIKQILK